MKPGVTQQLRVRASANVAAEAKRRRLTMVAVVLAAVAVCAYLLLHWLT